MFTHDDVIKLLNTATILLGIQLAIPNNLSEKYRSVCPQSKSNYRRLPTDLNSLIVSSGQLQ